MVEVDSQNEMRILVQAVLPAETTADFKFLMTSFIKLRDGLHPKARLVRYSVIQVYVQGRLCLAFTPSQC